MVCKTESLQIICFFPILQGSTALILTLNPLTWKIWWAPNNASRWQMGFNSAFKGLSYISNSGPDLATRARLLSFNRTQSRVVIGLLTGHNTLRKYLYIIGLSNNPTCRKCGTEEETSVHILCECEALASLIHMWVPCVWILRTLWI